METQHTPVEILYFCSDSPEDVPLLEQLERHLSIFQRNGLISTWHKRQIVAGSIKQVELEHHLNTATLILLLVSSDFLASDYCYGTEMQRALQRHKDKEAHVIPILLRSCVWQSAPFAMLEVLPTGAKPITSWPDQDAAWTDVAIRIGRALEELLDGKEKQAMPLSASCRCIIGIPPLTDPRAIQQREQVVEAIYAQLTQTDITGVALTGIGGVGKSTLAALVYQYTEKQRAGRSSPFLSETLWLTVDSTVTFADLVGNIFEALGKPMPQLNDLAPHAQAATLFAALNATNKPRIIIFDQFENLLSWETGHALTDRPGVGEWLDIINSQQCKCRFLLTSRPRPVGTYQYPPAYLQEYPVKGLERAEGVALLHKRYVEGTDEELQLAVVRCKGHALSLSLLATLIHDHLLPLAMLMKEPTLWIGNIARNLLNYIYIKQLNHLQRELLQAFSVYREPVLLEAAGAIITSVAGPQMLLDALQTLRVQHLIEPIGEGRYQLHAIIAEYVRGDFHESNGLLADEDTPRTLLHMRAALYYQERAVIRCPAPDERRNANDLHDFIEAAWHYCQAGQWQEAYHLIEQQRIFSSLKQWGSNAILLELCLLFQMRGNWSPKASQVAAIHRYLAWAYNALGKKDLARENNEKALHLYRESEDLQGQVNVLDSLGWSHYTVGQMKQAEEYYKQALALCKDRGDRRAEGHILNGLGRVYDVQGRRGQALEYFEQAFVLCKEIKNPRLEGLTLSNLGLIHTDFGNYTEALEYLEQSFLIRKGLGDRRGEGVARELTGRAYKERGREYRRQGQDEKATQDLEKAEKDFKEALSIYQTIGDRGLEGWALHNLGWTYHALGQYERARGFLELALSIRREVGDRRGESRTIRELGDIFSVLGQKKQALEYYRQALLISEKIPDPYGEGRVLQNVAVMYVDQARYDVVLACLLRARQIFDELNSPYRDEVQDKMGTIQETIGKEQFTALIASIEFEAQQIVKQTLFASEKP